VIHFLSEPFLTDEDYQNIGKEDYATNDYIVTSFALNSYVGNWAFYSSKKSEE